MGAYCVLNGVHSIINPQNNWKVGTAITIPLQEKQGLGPHSLNP